MAKIGLQAFMLRGVAGDAPFFETLRKVHELGYNSIELVGLDMFNSTVDEHLRARDEFGLEYSATSANVEALAGFGDSLRDDYDKVVGETKALGAKFIRIPMAPMSALASREAWVAYSRTINEFALRLLDEGIQLTYHNHHVEFMKFDNVHALDIMRDAAPDLHFEIDVHWAYRGGVDPTELLLDYAGLVDLVHLKDYRIGAFPKESLAALEAGDFEAFHAGFSGVVQFAEVGEGSLDFPGIIDTALATGVTQLIVEQDETYGRDVFECLRISRQNLLAMGYGQHF